MSRGRNVSGGSSGANMVRASGGRNVGRASGGFGGGIASRGRRGSSNIHGSSGRSSANLAGGVRNAAFTTTTTNAPAGPGPGPGAGPGPAPDSNKLLNTNSERLNSDSLKQQSSDTPSAAAASSIGFQTSGEAILASPAPVAADLRNRESSDASEWLTSPRVARSTVGLLFSVIIVVAFYAAVGLLVTDSVVSQSDPRRREYIRGVLRFANSATFPGSCATA